MIYIVNYFISTGVSKFTLYCNSSNSNKDIHTSYIIIGKDRETDTLSRVITMDTHLVYPGPEDRKFVVCHLNSDFFFIVSPKYTNSSSLVSLETLLIASALQDCSEVSFR